MEVDRVFIINLSYRVDRRESILRELKKVGITNFEFFSAIQPQNLKELQRINPRFLMERPHWLKDTDSWHYLNYRLGALGCLLSHLEILKIALKRNYKKILILEDDALFTSNVKHYANVAKAFSLQMRQKPFDLLYLGGTHISNHLARLTTNIFRTRSTGSTVGYIISRNKMQYIIDHAVQYGKEIDLFYIHRIQSQGQSYCILPTLVSQATGYSDICQENKSYRMNGIYTEREQSSTT